MTAIHKNSQKRYDLENETYFVTTKTGNGFPFFKEPIFCELFIENLKLCKELKSFKLLAFCLNYDHVHLLIQPGKEFNISKIMQSIKKEASRDINYIIKGGIPECRLHGVQYSHRYKKQFSVPRLQDFHYQFSQKYGANQTKIPLFSWQPSFHDHVIRDECDLQNHYNYTIYNFLKHKLPDNWQYTSLNYTEVIDAI